MKKFIGNKEFYRLVLTLALPLLLQNAITTFVNLLDNLMVGRIGTESMSGVAIVNQILFVYNLCLFGGTGGAGIFGAQFFGRGDHKGVRYSLRFNIVLCAFFSLIAIMLFLSADERLISAFLHDSNSQGDLALTLAEGRKYLRVMIIGLPAFAMSTAYVSILRVTGDNNLPMRASVAAILVNLFGNWVLIYGNLGAPRLGVVGAAVATVISRYVEFGLILLGTHAKKKRPEFLRGLYKGFGIPSDLMGNIAKRGAPLLCNEFLWSLSMTTLNLCYSFRGLDAVAALNINSTVFNFFNTVLFTMGNVVGIVLGNLLGAEEFDKARSYCPKLTALSCFACAIMGGLMFLTAPLTPRLYNTTPEIMHLAASLIRVCACMLPFHAIMNASYWTLRAGGRTYLTMLFDSIFCWVVPIPVAWCLMHLTNMPLLPAYIIANAAEGTKAILGIILVRRGIWVQNVIGKTPVEA